MNFPGADTAFGGAPSRSFINRIWCRLFANDPQQLQAWSRHGYLGPVNGKSRPGSFRLNVADNASVSVARLTGHFLLADGNIERLYDQLCRARLFWQSRLAQTVDQRRKIV